MDEVNKDFLYYPMLVSNTGTAEHMSQEEDNLLWKTFHALPQTKKDILTDGQMPIKIKALQTKYRLSEQAVGIISLVIRKIFFGEFSLSDVETKLSTLMGSNEGDAAREIATVIRNEIMTIVPSAQGEEWASEEEKEEVVQLISMPLLQALSKYEQLGNQLITRERIKVKSQGEPVRPSLLYWLKYYRDELGVGHHDSVQRGQFLFRSENGKRLSAEERERVNLILKSVEENLPLQVDTQRSEIVFPYFEASETPPAPAFPQETQFQNGDEMVKSTEIPQPQPAKKNIQIGRGLHFGHAHADAEEGGELSFSSSHVFPAEKESADKPRVQPATPPKANPFHIRPVSLMNKDEE